MHHRILLLSLLCLGTSFAQAQLDCAADEVAFTVVIQPDNWPGEMSWMLADGQGNLVLDVDVTGGQDTLFEFCLDTAAWNDCMVFTMNDSYGDGLYPGAFYQVWLEERCWWKAVATTDSARATPSIALRVGPATRLCPSR